MVNLPHKREGNLVGTYDPETNKIEIWNGKYLVDTMYPINSQLGADEIAHAIEQARDIGYRQAQKDMRESMGIYNGGM